MHKGDEIWHALRQEILQCVVIEKRYALVVWGPGEVKMKIGILALNSKWASQLLWSDKHATYTSLLVVQGTILLGRASSGILQKPWTNVGLLSWVAISKNLDVAVGPDPRHFE